MLPSDEPVSYWSLLKNGNFLRLFLAQTVSSLGDWIGVIAIAIFAERLGGTTAVGTVMIARVLPGFLVGPLAGVFADRWDRKRLMVVSDLCRAGIIFSLPFVPHLLYLLLASMVLESLTLVWGPAKDASLPHFVKTHELTHANSLSLISVYGPWPLASILFASMTALGAFLGDSVPVLKGLQNSEESLALWIDSLTFVFSAMMITTLSIPSSRRRAGRLDLGEVKRDLVEGLSFVRDHKQVRPWLLGIAFTFTAAGGVFSLGVGFVRDVLGATEPGDFGFLIGFLGTGMIAGLLGIGLLVKRFQKDVLFSSSLFLLGGGLIALASMGSLAAAIPAATALGFFGGAAYSTGYSLVQETTADNLRGRTFAAAYTVIRLGTLVGLGVFPLVAGLIGDHSLDVPFDGVILLPGSRITLWLAGGVVIGGGFLSMRAIRERQVKSDVGRTEARGYFVVFEGGEGAGKSTQMAALVKWLEARGDRVVTTREPGGTKIGDRIRSILLDPEASDMDPRTEALLYAADRSQHVAEVIKPALDEGKIVVSDRFVDSSLAYQGIARGLGLEEIYGISEWATGGMVPDLVFFLRVDTKTALGRVGDTPDRIEQESGDFHERVGAAYVELAKKFPARFVVLDASGSAEHVHESVVRCFEQRTSEQTFPLVAPDIATSSPPVSR